MPTPHSHGTSLVDVGRVIARRWKLATGFVLGSVTLAFLAWWFTPRTYHSESELLVRLGRESGSLDPAAVVGRPNQGSFLQLGRENEINSITEVLQSKKLLENVVDSIGPAIILGKEDLAAAHPETQKSAAAEQSVRHTAGMAIDVEWPRSINDRDRAIERLQRAIEVQAIKRSDVIRIGCQTRNPRLAQLIVARLVDFYLAEHLRLNRTAGAHEFLERQTSDMRDKLTQTSEALRRLKETTGVASPETQRDLLVNRVSRLEDQLYAAEADLISTEAETALLRTKLSDVPEKTTTAFTVGVPHHGAELMRNEYYRLQMLEQELAAKCTEQHFLLHQVRDRAAAAKEALDTVKDSREQVTSGPNVVFEQTLLALFKLEPTRSSLQARAGALRTQLAAAREDVNKFNVAELQISALSRDLQQQERDYQSYAQHLEQSRIDQALEAGRISNINIIQPATFEPRHIAPRGSLMVGLGLLIGLAGAIALPLVADALQHRTQHPRDVDDHLNIPVLATIPRFAEQRAGNGKDYPT